MMLIATVLLALLFVASFLYILLNFQPKKRFASWLQPLFTRRTSQESPHVVSDPAAAPRMAKSSGGATAHKRAELRGVFATFDKNKDGFVTKEELKESLKNIGIHMSEKEVADMVGNADSNGDGLIDLDEFCELFAAAAGGGEGAAAVEGGEVGVVEGGGEEGDLKEAFDVFDGDRDGLITVEELGMVLNSLGMKEGKRLENCKEMIRKVDMDGDGMVNFDEFKRMMKAGGRLIATS